MTWLVVLFASFCAGCIQSATGFGGAIIMMQFFPHFLGMVASPALVGAITLLLSTSLAWRFRRHIHWPTVLFPTALYILVNTAAINLVRSVNLDLLTAAFGAFMVVLAVYFMLFAGKFTFRPSWRSASLCAALSGCTAGFFGIGGPLMALYFVTAAKDKETYLANLQFLFVASNTCSLCTRVLNGIYTPALIPLTLLGFVGIFLGKKWGLKLLDKLDIDRMKKIIYILVGISGLLTLLKQIF